MICVFICILAVLGLSLGLWSLNPNNDDGGNNTNASDTSLMDTNSNPDNNANLPN